MKPRHITANSKEVLKGSIFIALNGKKFNGHFFVEDAILKGASTVYYSEALSFEIQKYPNVNFIFSTKLKDNLPNILKSFYNLPSHIIGITGTNGKTSIAFFTMQALAKLGIPAGFIGTIGILSYTNKIKYLKEAELTTPDIVSLYRTLANFKNEGIDHVVFEASSIGLAQKRIAGLEIEVACFTNFTQDHLDVHQNMQTYFNAKSLLFKENLSKKGIGIFQDNEKFLAIKNICLERGIKTQNLKQPSNVNMSVEGCEFDIDNVKFKLSIFADFQIQNMLFVIEICKYFGFDLKQIASIAEGIKLPSGRLECVSKKPYIFVDYAHTPDSVLQILQIAKKICNGKIIIVFGCGGDRDASKRTLMGEVASNNADFCIITDDNPRMEDPQSIRSQIILGCKNKNYQEIGNRKEAIKKSIELANEEDIIIIAGKGHEDYQIIGNKKQYFSDVKCVLKLQKDFFSKSKI